MLTDGRSRLRERSESVVSGALLVEATEEALDEVVLLALSRGC